MNGRRRWGGSTQPRPTTNPGVPEDPRMVSTGAVGAPTPTRTKAPLRMMIFPPSFGTPPRGGQHVSLVVLSKVAGTTIPPRTLAMTVIRNTTGKIPTQAQLTKGDPGPGGATPGREGLGTDITGPRPGRRGGRHGQSVPGKDDTRISGYHKVGRSGKEIDLQERKRCTVWRLVVTVYWQA